MTASAHNVETIGVVGARTNNLRDVTVNIPKGQVVAFTGVSGSGKTSLAIDTIHSEAQLRYLEGLSPFIRQYITQRNRPKVDRVLGLGATLAVDQRRLNRNPGPPSPPSPASTATSDCCTRVCRASARTRFPATATSPRPTSTGTPRREAAPTATASVAAGRHGKN